MNPAGTLISRRTFLLTGAAAGFVVSMPSLFNRSAALRVHMLGWGQHAGRFREAIQAGQMSVTSIFDVRLSRNRIAAAELSAAQGYAPSRHDSFRSFVETLHET